MSDAWAQAIADYSTYVAARGTNEMAIRPRRSYLRTFAREATVGPWEVTQADLMLFMARSHWQPETPQSGQGCAAQLLRMGAPQQTGSSTPTRACCCPAVCVPYGVPKPVPDDIIHAALDRATARDRLMLLLGASAGLRRAEIDPRDPPFSPDDLEAMSATLTEAASRLRRLQEPPH